MADATYRRLLPRRWALRIVIATEVFVIFWSLRMLPVYAIEGDRVAAGWVAIALIWSVLALRRELRDLDNEKRPPS